jgi:dTDP-4-amino-4,6-dideoxygalactose transaminase
MIIPGDLPPVGHRITLAVRAENPLRDLFALNSYWVDSGTSALALALLDAKAHLPLVTQPRAIIPGYCCPDLVAACVFAGIEPVAVDINPNDPAYDLEQLRAHLDDGVVAVIAVNFLGISEQLARIREMIAGLGLATRLIEDNAQWFPSQKSEANFDADYVVFSFGRGKPLSLLGGGLLLARMPLVATVAERISGGQAATLLRFKIRAYNLLLVPPLYLLLNRNPILHLGQTRFHPLDAVRAMDNFRTSLLAENFALYAGRAHRCSEEDAGAAAIVTAYEEALALSGLQQMSALHTERRRRLLRYPLLCATVQRRDEVAARLLSAGLGATPMYAAAIDQVDGVDGRVTVPAALDNARDFARRFITLPLHTGVTSFYQQKICGLLRNA